MTDPTDTHTNSFDAAGNIVCGVPDFGPLPMERQDDFQKIAGSRVPRMNRLKQSIRELSPQVVLVPKTELDAARAEIARLRGVIEAAAKG